MAAELKYRPPIKGGAPMTLEEFEARQGEIRRELSEIDVEFAGLRMTEDAKGRWNRLNEEHDENEVLIEELRTRKQRVDDLAAQPANTEAGAAFNVRRQPRAGADIWDVAAVRKVARDPHDEAKLLGENSKRALEQMHFPHPQANREDCQDAVQRSLNRFGDDDNEYGQGAQFARHLLITSSPTYRKAFGKALVGRNLSADESRALSLTGASGGYAVPVTLDPTIIPTSNASINPWRAISRVEQIVGSNTWNGITSGAVTASRDAELEEVSDDTPTLAQPTAVVTKAQAFIPFSMEVDQDWGRLEAEMARLIQDAKDDEEATAFTTGGGTGVNPQGVLTGATATVAAGTAAFTVAHAYALIEALAPRFRPNATFVANLAQYNRIRQLDTSGGASLWVQNLTLPTTTGSGNVGATFLGRPAYESSVMASALTAASKIMIVGDFRYFLIVDRVGLQIEIVPHLFGATNQRPIGARGLLAYWRNTSKVLSAAAFKTLVTT